MKHLQNFLFTIFFLSTTIGFSQIDESRMFIFGHSLLDHRPPLIPTPSNETTVPHWMFLLSQEAGKSYAAGGQYGFLPQHARTPPISQWGYDIVPGVWESDTEPFSDADISTVVMTAGNFMQWQAPDLEYPSDPGVTPISATIDIVDWVAAQQSDVRYYIYENWPDMAPYINGDFPPTASGFADYNNYTRGEFNDWWIQYHDAVLAARPDLEVRMIPVGPIISKLLPELLSNQIPLTELYEDNAPHGRPTIYFLAALTTYMAVYEEKAPANFVLPNLIHQAVRNNYSDIIDFIWNELKAFNLSNGDSRVFYGNVSSVTDSESIDYNINVWPNPSAGIFEISCDCDETTLVVFDAFGNEIDRFERGEVSNSIDLKAQPSGLYIFRFEDFRRGEVVLKRVVKD